MKRHGQNKGPKQTAANNGKAVAKQPRSIAINIPIPLPIRQETTSADNERYAEEKNSRTAQLRTAKRLNVITVIAAVVGIVSLFGLWVSIRQTRNQFTADQRPYVLVTSAVPAGKDGALPWINIRSANYGKSPALRLSSMGKVFVGTNAVFQADTWFSSLANNEGTGGPESTLAPGTGPGTSNTEGLSSFDFPPNISPAEINNFMTHDFNVVVGTRIIYGDMAGNTYTTDACRAFLSSGITAQCPKHNDVR